MNEPIGCSRGEGGAEGRWEAAGAGGAPGSPSSASSSSQAPARTTLGLPRRPLVRSRARRAGRATPGPCSRRRSSEEGGSPPPEGESARGAGKSRARSAPPHCLPGARSPGSWVCWLLLPPAPASLLARSLARAGFQAPRCARASAGRGAPGPELSRRWGSAQSAAGRGGAMSGAGAAGPVCSK